MQRHETIAPPNDTRVFMELRDVDSWTRGGLQGAMKLCRPSFFRADKPSRSDNRCFVSIGSRISRAYGYAAPPYPKMGGFESFGETAAVIESDA